MFKMSRYHRITKCGSYSQDNSGLWHYHSWPGHNALKAAADALEHRPVASAAWFWFAGTFCPINRNEAGRYTPETLVDQWVWWRDVGQTSAETLTELLGKLSTERFKERKQK